MPYQEYGESRNPEGRPSSWNHGKTRTIRVPIVLADEVMKIARELDKKEDTSSDTELRAVQVYRLRGEEVVKLNDVPFLSKMVKLYCKLPVSATR